ncbi:MAG: class I SAM-dependent methyltransferase, partial [Proteobacteria bacterium]|nr:class I SAM-dependent methyltransferase [Pseudomonadota bacterium]
AALYYDEVITCPVEEADLTGGFDLVNCGDILEHLRDPWAMLNRIHSLLRDEGYLVMSVPNVGHWSIVRNLMRGAFQYIPSGLLCATHLRWFTESSIRKALEKAGFSIEIFQREQIPPTPRGEAFIRDMCAAGYADETSLKTNEFVIRAVKQPNAAT